MAFLAPVPAADRAAVEEKLSTLCDEVVLLPSRYAVNPLAHAWHRTAGAVYAAATGLKRSNYVIGQVELTPARVATVLARAMQRMAHSVMPHWQASRSVGSHSDTVVTVEHPAGHKPHRPSNLGVLLAVLLTGAVVVLARVVAPLQINKDQAQQNQAAYNWINGRGLTVAAFTVSLPDVSAPSPTVPLGWWPPGYSVAVGLLLKAGCSPSAALKVLFMVATALGWLGWAVFAAVTLREPVHVFRRSLPVNYVMAVMLPVFLTPRWAGTDIILWAIVPWLVLAVRRTARLECGGVVSAGLAGALCGLAFSFRYASGFLYPATVICLLYLLRRRPDYMVRAVVAWAVTACLSTAPALLYSRLVGQEGSLAPEYVEVSATHVHKSLASAVPGLAAASESLVGSRFLVAAAEKTGRGAHYLLGIVTGVLVLLLPVLIHNTSKKKAASSYDLELLCCVAVFSLCLVAFLFVTGLVTNLEGGFSSAEGFLGESRYYLPLWVGGVCLSYRLWTLPVGLGLIRGVGAVSSGLFLVSFLLVLPVGALAGSPTLSRELAWRTVSFKNQICRPDGGHYASESIYTDADCCWRAVKNLRTRHPDALFLTVGFQPYFWRPWESDSQVVIGQNLREVPGLEMDYWSTAFASRSAKVFWILRARGESRRNASALSTVLGLAPAGIKTVFRDETAKLVIYETDLAAGTHFRAAVVR